MKKITINEMKNIYGGSINWGLLAGIGAFASFFIGIVDGWVHPRKCN